MMMLKVVMMKVDDESYLVIKVIQVKEVMSGEVLPVAMFSGCIRNTIWFRKRFQNRNR